MPLSLSIMQDVKNHRSMPVILFICTNASIDAYNTGYRDTSSHAYNISHIDTSASAYVTEYVEDYICAYSTTTLLPAI